MTHTDSCAIPSDIVAENYVFDPLTEIVLFGSALREGMVVVLEHPFFRANPAKKRVTYQLPTPRDELLVKARWCLVEHLEPVQNDVITFTAVYVDGVKVTRRYSVTMGWYVKKDSLPSS